MPSANTEALLASFQKKCVPSFGGDRTGRRTAFDAGVDAARAPDGGVDAPVERSIVGPSEADNLEAKGARIIPKLRAQASGGTRGGEATFAQSALGGFDLTDPKTSARIKITLSGARDAKAEIAQGYVVYLASQKDGGDVLFRPTREGAEDFISFANTPAVEETGYDVVLDNGIAGVRAHGGAVEFLDAKGAPRLRMGVPTVIGATCDVVVADVSVTGCAFDASPAPPWGRPVTPPGGTSCHVNVSWSGKGVSYPALLDPAWTSTGSMYLPRERFALVTLNDGKLLAAGGYGTTYNNYTELYDPGTGTWAFSGNGLYGSLQQSSRAESVYALLPSGKVLVAGGYLPSGGASTDAEVYDPATGLWTPTGAMQVARGAAAGVLLPNGTVLVTGGDSANGGTYYASTEVYTPASNSWTTGTSTSMTTARSNHTATLLGDGTVITVGGYNPTNGWHTVVDRRDTSGQWTAAAPLNAGRYVHSATLLPSGKVLIAGGETGSGYVVEARLYDPVANSWATAGNLPNPRFVHGSILLNTGKVAIVGGFYYGSALADTQYYDPSQAPASAWSAGPSISPARWGARVAKLSSGMVVVAGGSTSSGTVGTTEILDQCVGVTVTDNNACTTDSCNSSTGVVSHAAVSTDDANACTADSCNSSTGVVSHVAVSTDDGNACTTDSCNTSTGVSHAAVSTDDGNACTADSCNTSTGVVSHAAVSTDDGNACTTDSCNTSTGVVSHAAVPTDDSNACTADSCNSSTGVVSHAAVSTDDANICTTDSCDTTTGVAHAAVPGCVDSDSDGMNDPWETANFGSLSQTATGDFDSDGMTNGEEYLYGFNPTVQDSFADADGDRYPNIFEIRRSADPNNAASIPTPNFVVNGAGGGTHTSVSAAYAAADTANGAYQIIGIAPGVYTGSQNDVQLTTSKPKFLIIGLEGAAKTILDGGGNTWGWEVFNDAVISSLTFQHWYQALAVITSNQEARLVDLIVRDNANTQYAAGVGMASSKVYVVGSTFLDNVGGTTEGQIRIGTGSATILNTVVWAQGTATVLTKGASATLVTNNSLVKGQTLTGTGNLAGNVDPKLRSDLRLRFDSPLRGAGGTVLQSRIDVDGELRPSTSPDIGVDQFNDSDNDGLPDAWEIATYGNTTSLLGTADDDSDGLTNAQEHAWETNRLVPDTDRDGLTDGAEVAIGTNPLVADADELAGDLNQDGLIDSIGAQLGYQPNYSDSDGDSVSNADESLMCTNPLRTDSDGDGVPDSTDPFPLDPLLSALSSNPQDVTPPVITLTAPSYAVEQ